MGRTIEVDDDKVVCYTADGSVHLISNKTFNAMLFMDGIRDKDDVYFRPYVRYENGSKMFSVSKGEFEKIAREADAVHLHNRTAYVDVKQVCRYIDSLSPQSDTGK